MAGKNDKNCSKDSLGESFLMEVRKIFNWLDFGKRMLNWRCDD